MPAHLRVRAGSSTPDLRLLAVNDPSQPFLIDTPAFRGGIAVRIKDFRGERPEGSKNDEAYFGEKENKGFTWSIEVQGRFLEELTADDLVFGNVFEKPIRDRLPYGTSLALKFVNFIDPCLTADLYADQPWAWSPLLATVTRLRIALSTPKEKPEEEWEDKPVEEDVAPFLVDQDVPEAEAAKLRGNARERRRWFMYEKRRKSVRVGPKYNLKFDFVNGLLDFNTLSLNLPGTGLSFSLLKYWDGQPVRYFCRNRAGTTTFFVIEFQIVDVGDDAPKEAREAEKAAKAEGAA